MSKTIDIKHVKSALRALEVLEFFDTVQPSACVNEIAKYYDYPQSSTSELMTCLVTLGFLRRDANGRRYALSSRVATLGSRVQPKLFRHGKLYMLIDELSEATSASVVLAGINHARMQYLQIVGDDDSRAAIAREDHAAALLHSAEGLALLSTFPTEEAKRLVNRINSEVDEPIRVRLGAVLTALDETTDRGYAMYEQPGKPTSFAITLPHADSGERLVLGIRPTGSDMAEDEIVRLLSAGVSRHLGFAVIPPSPRTLDSRRYAS